MQRHNDLALARVLLDAEVEYEALRLNEDESDNKIKLEQLINVLRAFEHIQTSWTRSFGVIADYYARTQDKQILKPITQEELTKEAIETIKNSAGYAQIFAETLLEDINQVERCYFDLAKRYPKLVKEVEECARIVRDSASTIWSDLGKEPFSASIYWLASNLGARFIPSKQDIDPIAGKKSEELGFIGVCYGHVMRWRDEIESHGKFLSQPRHDQKTFTYQNNQRFFWEMEEACKNRREIWAVLNNLLLGIEDDYIYKFSFRRKYDSHAMGFRKLENGGIEFFDPNFGLFNFIDMGTFKLWCTELLSLYLFNDVEFTLTTKIIGSQTIGSGTIPLINIGESESLVGKVPGPVDGVRLHSGYINHLGILNTNKKITQIEIRQKKEIDLVESWFYLGRLEASSFPDVDAGVRHCKNIEYEKCLKKRITDSIDREILRLQGNIVGDSSKKILALKALKVEIGKLDHSQSLITTIETWLSAKNSGDLTKTNQAIICAERMGGSQTRTYQFVLNLATNNEINVANMRFLQSQLLLSVVEMIDFYNSLLSEKRIASIPSTFKFISESILTKNSAATLACGEATISSYITRIQERCSQNTTGMFERVIKWRDGSVDQFYKIIKKLDQDNPSSLIQATNELKKLFETVRLEYERPALISRISL